MVITGDGPQASYMRRKMPNAVFTGKLMGKDLSKIYASCDIFVFPSITETFGNVVLEALASGIPAVVAAQGGPKGIIRDGSTGFHVIPKNSEDFYKKLCFLIDNPDLLNKMKKNAAAYARTQSWDALCREMFSEYEKHLTKIGVTIEDEKNEIAV
jgi:glycosyltransferase involved in cell wall biosynthesis